MRISLCHATGSSISRNGFNSRNFWNASLRRRSISGVACGLVAEVPLAAFSVAVTSIFPCRNYAGSGKCSVPSASASNIAVIVLMPQKLSQAPARVKQLVPFQFLIHNLHGVEALGRTRGIGTAVGHRRARSFPTIM